jgi:hypothetical protein
MAVTTCPKCKSPDIRPTTTGQLRNSHRCNSCGHVFRLTATASLASPIIGVILGGDVVVQVLDELGSDIKKWLGGLSARKQPPPVRPNQPRVPPPPRQQPRVPPSPGHHHQAPPVHGQTRHVSPHAHDHPFSPPRTSPPGVTPGKGVFTNNIVLGGSVESDISSFQGNIIKLPGTVDSIAFPLPNGEFSHLSNSDIKAKANRLVDKIMDFDRASSLFGVGRRS